MPELRDKPDRNLFVVLTLVFAVATALTASLYGSTAQIKANSTTPAPAPDDYAGQDTCLTCHEDHNYKGTLHALAANPRTPAATHGCESCHGPGK